MSIVKKTENFDDPGKRHWSWGTPDARPGSLVTYLERPSTERRSHMGTGQGHHYALAVANEAVQLEMRDRLLDAGVHVSPVLDRVYSRASTPRSRWPIVELATMGPDSSSTSPWRRRAPPALPPCSRSSGRGSNPRSADRSHALAVRWWRRRAWHMRVLILVPIFPVFAPILMARRRC